MGRITKAKIKKGKFGTALKSMTVKHTDRRYKSTTKGKYTKTYYKMIEERNKKESQS